MRVVINAAFLSKHLDGMRTYTEGLVEALSGSGSELYLYVSRRAGLNADGRVKQRPVPSNIGLNSGTAANAIRVLAWSQTILPAMLARDRADVLLTPLPEGMFLPVCPQVVVVHDLFPVLFPELYPRWKYYFQHVLPKILRASSRVIAVSNHTKQDLVRHLGVPEKKITVVYNWLNPLFLSDQPGTSPEGHEERPYFLFIGRATPHKNLEMVIQAFGIVQREFDHDLVCVLNFPSEMERSNYARILDLATRLGIRERLRLYTGISRAELLFLYKHATALLLLSKYEGFGYPPLEAMAVGTPAIVSDSTSLAEVAGPGAICVSNAEPYPAAKAMKQLACDPAFRAEMSERGRAHAQQFSAERSVDLIRTIVEDCANSGSTRCD